ncbi:MAG: nitrile hydratase subunit beta, partial [Burkholderiales bacterium]|nr:nitrile hydratase subunit beta [Burkholderiales bacterium]
MLLTPDIVPGLVATGATARIDEPVAPRFRAGEKVIVRNINKSSHTRLAGYT